MSDALEIAREGDLSLREWPPSGGLLLYRDGDDLNEPQGFHLTREEMAWLAFYPGLMIAGEVSEAQRRPLRKTPGSG